MFLFNILRLILLFLNAILFLATCMHFYCQQTGCNVHVTPPNILCVVLLMYVWGSSSVPNEDVWPSV